MISFAYNISLLKNSVILYYLKVVIYFSKKKKALPRVNCQSSGLVGSL